MESVTTKCGKQFILASASPRRQELLAKAGFSFDVEIANVCEDEDPDGDPAKAVAYNARAKALAVAGNNPTALVLGADTTVALDGRVFNKPVDLDDARAMLKALSGRTHIVYTGVCLVLLDKHVCEENVFASKVTFKDLSDEVISLYFKVVNPLDKAGAYGIQEGRELIIESYEEPLSNIMGLPVERIRDDVERLLKK